MESDDSTLVYWTDTTTWHIPLGISWRYFKGDLIGVYLHCLCFTVGLFLGER